MPFLAIVTLLLLSAPAFAAPATRPTAAPAPAVMFYIAKGAPDSCGRGCDRWIAMEGQINGDAAGRFKTFISGI